tara:strand:+ start:17 stop:628 length:612 start_codon:yes stop_codon:yes gene_type:complete
MKKFIGYTILLLLVKASIAQIDSTLTFKLDSCVSIDQKWRGTIRQIRNSQIDTVDLEFATFKMNQTDSLNYLFLNRVFKKYGFLGFDKVGKSCSHQFWLLIQHQDKNPEFQHKVLNKMEAECKKGNASYIDYAYLLDRVKINTNQPQVYGTQMKLNNDSTSYEPKTLIKPSKVNDRRKAIGLFPIEKYIETMNSRYFGTLNKN